MQGVGEGRGAIFPWEPGGEWGVKGPKFMEPVRGPMAQALAGGPMRKSWLLSLMATGLVGQQAPQSAAQVKDDLAELQALLNVQVVTASRFSQRADDAPATVIVVSEEQIKRRGYHSLQDLMKDLPDYKVENRADVEWYSDVTVRGVPGHDKFVILLDGFKISSPANEQIPLLENYPIHFAKQVEVVLGPASALYGADAVSGVINIITQDKARSFEGEVRGGQNGSRLVNFFAATPLAAGLKLTIGGQWFKDDQPDLSKDYDEFEGFAPQRTGAFNTIFGPRTATDYDPDPSFQVKTQALFGSISGGGLRFSFFTNSSRTPTSVDNKPGSAIYNDDVFIGHRLTVLGLSHLAQAGAFAFQSSIQSGEYRLNPNSNFRNAFTAGATTIGRGYKYAESGSLKAEEQVTWSPRESLTLIGGLSLESTHAIPWSTDLSEPVNPNGAVAGNIRGTNLPADFFPLNYRNLGAYVQGQFQFSKDVILTAGLRYDDNSRFGSTTNPRLGLVWHVSPSHNLKMLYGTAFLAPSPYAAFAHFGSFFSTTNDGTPAPESFFWRLPNPGLKPIKERSLEFGYRGYLTGTLSLSATLYRTELRNLYSLQNDATSTQMYNGVYKGLDVAFIEVRTNLGKQTNTGGTVRLDYLNYFGDGIQFNPYLSWSRVDGKVDPKEDGNEIEIGRIASDIIRAGVDVQGGRFSGSLRVSRVGEQRMEALDAALENRLVLDGYTVVDLNARAELGAGVYAMLGVSNATNRKHYNINQAATDQPSSIEFVGAPQDLRRAYVSVGWKY